MGKATEIAGDGGTSARDGGARDARAVCGRGRATRPAAQHTAARRRVRTGRASTVTSPLSGTHLFSSHSFTVILVAHDHQW